ncbi:MAG: hypothetical protein ACYTJ0_13825, partial [Planctomycetota bacterium]
MTSARWIGGALTASIAAAATSGVPAQAPPDGPGPRPDPREQQRADDRKPSFEGYDFGQVVATMETSVNPLQREMDQSFRVFVETIEEAEQLLEAGETHEAVQRAAAALDIVLAARDQVLGPRWDGQQVLSEQIATVRSRLATAVQASRRGP